MDWPSALQHLPYRLAVTDRKGRVLLLSAPIAGIKVGRSFLRLAEQGEVVAVGRAAKAALADNTERVLGKITGADGTAISVRLTPFSNSGGEPDHLLVTVGEPERKRPRSLPPRKSRESAVEVAEQTTAPIPIPKRPGELAPAPPAGELVVVAAGGTLPLARALESVMSERVRTRAWPVAKLVDALSTRGGSEPDDIESALDPTTRVVFVGESPYADEVRQNAVRQASKGTSGWAIRGERVRIAAIWADENPDADKSDLVADLQFEMMEIVRKAMPVRRSKSVEVPPALKSAAEFLEQPACMDMSGDIAAQARHHQLVMAVARFIQQGMDALIDPSGG